RDLPRLLRPGGEGVRGHRSSGPRGARGRSLRAARQVQHCRRRHAGHPQRVSRGGDYEKELIAERVATERSILSRILRVLPSPLWGGAGGGGSSYEATLVLDRTTPPHPARLRCASAGDPPHKGEGRPRRERASHGGQGVASGWLSRSNE